MQFSLDDVRTLARLLKEHNLGEIAIEATANGPENTAGNTAHPSRLVIRRAAPIRPHPTGGSGKRPAASSPGTTTSSLPTPTSAGVQSAGETESSAREPDLITVTATAVGLFRSVEPALKVGDRVRAGKPVGSVESLKVPNDVNTPVNGEIVEFLVEEGQGIEYGQPLVVLRPALP